jgi:hypothetical protein
MGVKTWSLTLREHRLRMFERRVQRGIFGPMRGEVTGGWRKLRNEELRNLHSFPCIIKTRKSRRMRWARHVDESRENNGILVEMPEGKRPQGRLRLRWVDNIKVDLAEIGSSGMD